MLLLVRTSNEPEKNARQTVIFCTPDFDNVICGVPGVQRGGFRPGGKKKESSLLFPFSLRQTDD